MDKIENLQLQLDLLDMRQKEWIEKIKELEKVIRNLDRRVRNLEGLMG